MLHNSPTGQEDPGFQPRPFRPPRWLRGPNLQTLVGRLLRSRARCRYRRERIELPDGDFLDIDPTADGEAPFVLLLHGLEGSAESGYIRLTSGLLATRGIRAVALNFRSCSGEPNRLPRSYHSGETGDLHRVLEILRERHPGSACGAIGFSLGGNVLLKYLGERGGELSRWLRGAVAVSVPFDLAASARRLERGVGRLYSAYFLRSLKSKTEEKAARFPGEIDVAAARAARTLWAFDDAITAPVHGFQDAEEYYRRSSSARYLPGVRVPTLLLQAVDDPFVPPDSLPLEAVRENPFLIPSFQARGGHLGFVSGASPVAPAFWAESEAVRFISTRLLGGDEGEGT